MASAAEAYEGLAPFYDELTREHDYEGWTYHLEQVALRFGVSGRRLLDAACGTGKSFVPFLERGYEVAACDISPAMVAVAAEKAAGRARVEVRDMRSLPRLGEFDLVCCLDDAVNYLQDEAELIATFRGLRRNLAARGVVVFDANTLMAYRSFFASATVVQAPDRVLVWDGRTPADLPSGGAADAELLALERDGDWWSRTRSVHHQRHHPEAAIRAALAAAGLPWVAIYGMQLDGSVSDGFAELANSKAVYVARPSAPE